MLQLSWQQNINSQSFTLDSVAVIMTIELNKYTHYNSLRAYEVISQG